MKKLIILLSIFIPLILYGQNDETYIEALPEETSANDTGIIIFETDSTYKITKSNFLKSTTDMISDSTDWYTDTDDTVRTKNDNPVSVSSARVANLAATVAKILDSLGLYEDDGVFTIGKSDYTDMYSWNLDGDTLKLYNHSNAANQIKYYTEDVQFSGAIRTVKNAENGGYAEITSLASSIMLPGFWTVSESGDKGLYLLSECYDNSQTEYGDAAFYMNARQSDASELTGGNLVEFANGQNTKAYIDFNGSIVSVQNSSSNGYLSNRSSSGSLMLPAIWASSESDATGFNILAFPDDTTSGFTTAGVHVNVRKNDASDVTKGNLLQISNNSTAHYQIDHEGYSRFIRNPRSFSEYTTGGDNDPIVSVGKLGNQEANLSFNMNYRTGVHKLYDTTQNAFWLFMNNRWAGLQFAVDTTNSIGDIWSNSSRSFYPFAVDSAGRFAINIQKGYTYGDENLYVNGKATITDTVNALAFVADGTGTTYADYVFEDDYNLLSFEKQVEYWKKNKSLPALHNKGMSKKGISLSNVAARTEGAIEELEKLYLYVAQQDSVIRSLTYQIQSTTGADNKTSKWIYIVLLVLFIVIGYQSGQIQRIKNKATELCIKRLRQN